MYGCASIGWLSTFHNKDRDRESSRKVFSDFFALKVFYVKRKAKMLKISAGWP